MSRHRYTPTAKLLFGVVLAVITNPISVLAAPGSIEEPLVIPGFPFIHHFSTTSGTTDIDTYDCASTVSEHGPEVVYVVDIPSAGRLLAHLEGDDPPIDIDIHVLERLDINASRVASGCLARDHVWAETDVEAGRHYLVVDSYEGASRAGPYRLRVEFQPLDDWYNREIAPGVTLRTKVYTDLFGRDETGSVLEVDLSEPGVEIRALGGAGCARTSNLGEQAGAVAAINGGFFGDGCGSVSLLKIDGTLVAANSVTRSAFGVSTEGEAMIELIAAGADWPEAHQAVGGMPRIVSDGEVDVRDDEESVSSSFVTTLHPRTAIGIDEGGDLIMATIDGRTSHGDGLPLDELAQWMVWLGSVDALNLDGGGSTTLWVASELFDGVVNFPSDSSGERYVGSAIGVFAAPLDRPTQWLTQPPEETATEGQTWSYSFVANDPDGNEVSFEIDADDIDGTVHLEESERGAGAVTFTPSWQDGRGSPVSFVLRAVVVGSDDADQVIQISVIFVDSDDDDMADSWETSVGLNPNADDAAEDPDGDGFTNIEEFINGSDPLTSDWPAEPDMVEQGPDVVERELDAGAVDSGLDVVQTDDEQVDSGSLPNDVPHDQLGQDSPPSPSTTVLTSDGCSCSATSPKVGLLWMAVTMFVIGVRVRKTTTNETETARGE